MDPQAAGTLITNTSEKDKIKSIAAKDGITAIKIQSSRMLLAHGFLRRVFEVFERIPYIYRYDHHIRSGRIFNH
jgi:aspartate kinase